MDTGAGAGHYPGVPLIENKLPSMTRISLARREHRADVVMHTQRMTTPSRLVLDARDEARRLHERLSVEIATGDAAAISALVAAAVKVRAQLLDLLSLPTRPRGETRRRMLTLAPEAVSDVHPLPPDPTTLPGVPPIAPG